MKAERRRLQIQDAFFALRPFLPFTAAMPLTVMLGVSLLCGVMAIIRSPAATLAVLSQTRAKGQLSSFTLAVATVALNEMIGPVL